MSIQLLRESRLFVSTVESGFSKDNTMEILIQDDLDFGVSGNFTDIQVNEAGPVPVRGTRRYNDSLNPGEWSFSTYILPYKDKTSGKMMVPDYMLWHALVSGKPVDVNGTDGFHTNETNALVDFKTSAFHELRTLHIFVRVGEVWYKIRKTQVNQAEISVDIENIATVSWSGNGTEITVLEEAPFKFEDVSYVTDELYHQLQESYLVNKLTIMHVTDNEGTKKDYSVPITGATFTVNNNITYLTPNTLSRIDRPIGSFTGAISITGSLTAYLNTNPLGTAELYKDLLDNLSSVNSYTVSFVLGGEYDDPKPVAVIAIPQANLSIPSLEIDDVLSTQIEFSAQPTEMDAGDQAFFAFSSEFDKTKIAKVIKDGDAHTVVDPGVGG